MAGQSNANEPSSDNALYVDQDERQPTFSGGCSIPAISVAVAIFFLLLGVIALSIPKHKSWVHPQIDGWVIDANSLEEGLEGVQVRVINSTYTNQSTITDDEGRFHLDAVHAMEYTYPGTPVKHTELLFVRDGYEPLHLSFFIFGGEVAGNAPPPERAIEVTLHPLAGVADGQMNQNVSSWRMVPRNADK
jgi:hypothetical protein